MRPGHGSKEPDTGLLPRKVGEDEQRAFCSHSAGHWAHVACSPISWAVLGGCLPRSGMGPGPHSWCPNTMHSPGLQGQLRTGQLGGWAGYGDRS